MNELDLAELLIQAEEVFWQSSAYNLLISLEKENLIS